MAPFSVALFVSFMSLVPRLSNHSDAVASATVCLVHFADKVLSRGCLIFYPLTGYSINKEKERHLGSALSPAANSPFSSSMSLIETIP